MVWPTANIPTYGRGVWLECNGQSFSTTQFPQLYETLGTNRVPDYQGMFLRGYGSQSYSQNNGRQLSSSTNYSSSSIGKIQGDSIREIPRDDIYFSDHVAIWTSGGTPSGVVNWFENDLPHYEEANVSSAHQAHRFIMPIESDSDALSFFNPWTYKYSLNYSTSTDEDGNEHIESIELIEEKELVGQTTLGYAHVDGVFHINHNYPVSNEFRPVNKAVKFMIKAK